MCKELNEGGMMKSNNLNLKVVQIIECIIIIIIRMYKIYCMDSGNGKV